MMLLHAAGGPLLQQCDELLLLRLLLQLLLCQKHCHLLG
jgi:hypothetical protein